MVCEILVRKLTRWVVVKKYNPLGGCATSGNASGNYEHVYNESNQVRTKGCRNRRDKREIINNLYIKLISQYKGRPIFI